MGKYYELYLFQVVATCTILWPFIYYISMTFRMTLYILLQPDTIFIIVYLIKYPIVLHEYLMK